MALTIVGVQGSRIYFGPDLQQESRLFIPGTSDYVTNGYVITAASVAMGKIQYAEVVGMNATASGFTADPIFALAQVGSGGPGFSGYTQFLFKVLVVTTGVEVANGGNLTGCIWEIAIGGY